MHKYFFISFCFVVFLSCRLHRNTEKASVKEFRYLKACMSGDFSSEEQSKNDSDFFDIRLRMVPIWESASTSRTFYLYVEQAVATSVEKPYRQRVYRVELTEQGEIISRIFTVQGPERLTNKNAQDPIFKQLTPDSLQIKDGCEVYLTYDKATQSFGGSTKDRTCPSDRNGASYTTSRVNIYNDQMISWDQGWDKNDQQVWGATKGGYIFKKKK